MDPSKRICLKHLPDGVTKREIAELIRNRTGAQPHSIDLGFDANGAIRHYAHFSCEGAKNVVEVLQTGVVMRDQTVYGFPAKPHYSFALAEARRKREREEEVAKEQLAARLEEEKQRAWEKSHHGELNKNKMPKKTAFSVKPKYGNVASELAKKFRDAHRLQQGKTVVVHGVRGGAPGAAAAGGPSASSSHGGGAAAAVTTAANAAAKKRFNEKRGKHGKAGKHENAKKAAAPPVAAPPPPPAPPQPSKEEKKLSGLQARLAALKEKLKKS